MAQRLKDEADIFSGSEQRRSNGLEQIPQDCALKKTENNALKITAATAWQRRIGVPGVLMK